MLRKRLTCVRWEYLFLVLEHFGFAEKSINSIENLYSAPTARIQINGCLADHVKFERFRDAPFHIPFFFFALYIELLAQAIREDCSIQGILVFLLVVLYADDVLLNVSNPDDCQIFTVTPIGLKRIWEKLGNYRTQQNNTINNTGIHW